MSVAHMSDDNTKRSMTKREFIPFSPHSRNFAYYVHYSAALPDQRAAPLI